MTAQSLAADVLDGLLATWQADPTLTGYGDRLRIYDGPPTTDRAAEIELWVGANGVEAEEEVVTGTQDWAAFNQSDDRDETIDVVNAIWVANGSHDIKGARRLAFQILDAAAGAVRGSALGIAAAYPATQVVSWSLRQGEYTSGVGAVITFTVRVTGQL